MNKKNEIRMYKISLNYVTFGIIAENSVVTYVPEVAKWALNKSIDNVLDYYKKRKNAKIEKVNIDILKYV